MIGNDWDLILKDEFHKPYFIKLVKFLNEECKKKVIYPKNSDSQYTISLDLGMLFV